MTEKALLTQGLQSRELERGAAIFSELQRFHAVKDRAFMGRQPQYFDAAVVIDVVDFRCLRDFLGQGMEQRDTNVRDIRVLGLRVFTK